MDQLRDLRYRDDNDIQEFVSIFEEKVRQIEELIGIDEEILMSTFMDALRDSFDIMKRSFRYNQIISIEKLKQMTIGKSTNTHRHTHIQINKQ